MGNSRDHSKHRENRKLKKNCARAIIVPESPQDHQPDQLEGTAAEEEERRKEEERREEEEFRSRRSLVKGKKVEQILEAVPLYESMDKVSKQVNIKRMLGYYVK